MFAQAPSTLFHCPGNQLSLRLWLPQEPNGGLNSAVFLWMISVATILSPEFTGTSVHKDWACIMTDALRKCPGAVLEK